MTTWIRPLTPAEPDTRITPEDVFTPIQADSSHLAAIPDAVRGRDIVPVAPPWAGKSQTIVHLICRCLANRKTVLFVAEKSAALDIVHRPLKTCDLSDTILELH